MPKFISRNFAGSALFQQGLFPGFFLMMALVEALSGGCKSPKTPPQSTSQNSPAGVSAAQTVASSIFWLKRGDYPEGLGIVIDEALRHRGFNTPWIVVRGPDQSLWIISERLHSVHTFERVYVRVNTQNQTKTSIAAYQFAGSAWASLGKLLTTRFELEEEELDRELKAKLANLNP